MRGGERYDRRELCEFDPFPRTVGEVLQEVLRKEAPGKRPKPQHKRARAELTREEGGENVKGKEVVFAWLRQEADSQSPKRAP